MEARQSQDPGRDWHGRAAGTYKSVPIISVEAGVLILPRRNPNDLPRLALPYRLRTIEPLHVISAATDRGHRRRTGGNR